LFLQVLLYTAIGSMIARIIKQFFWVPHHFRYDILAGGGWGNVGDRYFNVCSHGITAMAPFNGTDVQNLSVAYISVYILVFRMTINQITLFLLGGTKLIKMDLEGPDVGTEDVRERMRTKRGKLGASYPH
ncbi:hypothetical protein PAXRUDRAFT_164202, partial [Paxillus rubicundulus Ve08.2h10]